MFAEADAKAHKVPGQEATRWEFNVVDHLEGFEAPLVGIIQNRFKAGKDIDQYDTRTDDDVLLEPIIDDVLGERSREGLSNVRVVELKEKIAAAKSDNADARTRLLEEREREMRKDEEMMRRKAEKFTAALKKLEDEGQSSVGALEDDLRRLQG